MADYGITGFSTTLPLWKVVRGMATIFPSFAHLGADEEFMAVDVAQDWLNNGSTIDGSRDTIQDILDCLNVEHVDGPIDDWPPSWEVVTTERATQSHRSVRTELRITSYNERCTIISTKGGRRVVVEYDTPTLTHVRTIEALLAEDPEAHVHWRWPGRDKPSAAYNPHGLNELVEQSLKKVRQNQFHYVENQYGTAGIGASFGGADVVSSETPLETYCEQTRSLSGPYSYEEAVRIAAEDNQRHDAFRDSH